MKVLTMPPAVKQDVITQDELRRLLSLADAVQRKTLELSIRLEAGARIERGPLTWEPPGGSPPPKSA